MVPDLTFFFNFDNYAHEIAMNINFFYKKIML